jgi:hypothetical protein
MGYLGFYRMKLVGVPYMNFMYVDMPQESHTYCLPMTLLFLEASEEQAPLVHAALRRYERCTSQLINPAKCSMMFGVNCPETNQQRVKNILNVENTTAEEKYLGLPTPEVRIKNEESMGVAGRGIIPCSGA